MAEKLQGKVILVTGGGSGIGRATSLLLAAQGARIMIADYVPEGAEKTVAMIKEAGGVASCVARCDDCEDELSCVDEHAPKTKAKIPTALIMTKSRSGLCFRLCFFIADDCPNIDCEENGDCRMIVSPTIR